MIVADELLERQGTATDRIVRAILTAIEARRGELDADAFLESVRIEVRLVPQGGEPRRGYEIGDVRAVIVQQQTEMRLPPR